ncbi:MAG TPA: glycosyltransferase, partial [Stellaceae bacterium]|nr:glycosyltransferase [Stellaceae bacterium]
MRFLSLATYPCGMPRHGGQARLHAIHRQLEAAGWRTRQFAVCPHGVYGEAAREDGVIEMTAAHVAEIAARHGRTDVSAADFLLSDRERYLERLFDLIEIAKPDVISLEQAWLWPALKEYFATFGNRERYAVVYSAHNVETALLAAEAGLAGAPALAPAEFAKARAIEEELAREADGILAVSEADAADFRTLNPRVLFAPNGVAREAEPAGLDEWTRLLGPHRLALYVGSAHPPNAAGFLE